MDSLKKLGHTEYQIPGLFEKSNYSVRWSVQPKQNYRKKKTDSQYINIVNTLLICQKQLANRSFILKYIN